MLLQKRCLKGMPPIPFMRHALEEGRPFLSGEVAESAAGDRNAFVPSSLNKVKVETTNKGVYELLRAAGVILGFPQGWNNSSVGFVFPPAAAPFRSLSAFPSPPFPTQRCVFYAVICPRLLAGGDTTSCAGGQRRSQGCICTPKTVHKLALNCPAENFSAGASLRVSSPYLTPKVFLKPSHST